MSTAKTLLAGWRGIALVAITYVYFLIFAQFAFLSRLAALGIADDHLKIVMAAMAGGGILFSLLCGRPALGRSPSTLVRLALVACGLAAFASLLSLNLAAAVAVAFLIGSSLGALTVTLVSNLGLWLGTGEHLLKVGLGTGLGYLLCNLPRLFTATPGTQAAVAGGLCFLGVVAAAKTGVGYDSPTEEPSPPSPPFVRVLVAFTALVWLDSAAFFIIQNTPSLKAGTWEGSLHLWLNGALHLVAAVVAALLLRRRGLNFVLVVALMALAAACLLLLDPSRALAASIFYPVGVSLYSVALVAYPSVLANASSPALRARRAALIYAVAGWFGSAMGIGMGQHLGHVPIAFVALAILCVAGPQMIASLREHKREAGLIAGAGLIALGIHRLVDASRATPPLVSAAERGRRVYIAEGCINCHSQYVRPGTPDVLMWGPAQTIEELRAQQPPLIGNRRQGPDLSQVGGRRSPLWLKAHFYNPREVSHASFMPSYAYLFQGSTRGDDLVAYLSELKSPAYAKHIRDEEAWTPSPQSGAAASGSTNEGAEMFGAYCGTCHQPGGQTRQRWRTNFRREPPNLPAGPWMRVPISEAPGERLMRLARIAKFGIPGTDMPGHEYLSDRDIISIAQWLNRTMPPSAQVAATYHLQGETR